MPAEKLPFSRQLAYAAGMMGWSILTNTIIVMLPYYYLPPSNAGLVPLVPQLLLLGVVNILSVIAASGRLIDALYDPFIASLSDKSKNPGGRRIPFMKMAALPAAAFCFLTFHPVQKTASISNAWWLELTMILFFIAATTYIIPYNALLPEMAKTPAEKVRLSSFQQVGFVLGIIVAALANNFADLVQGSFHITDRATALQMTIGGICAFAALILFIPVLCIDEKKYTLVICSAFPLASLGILPNAILTEIAQQDAAETGENREGMFFAVKYLFVKLGQTLGIALFAFLTIYGKDPGHDHGLRLNGICGMVLCLLAFVFFSRFKEK